MTRQDLENLFRFNEFVLGKNLADLTHADSLAQATPGGSSIHWIVGHLLATRNATLRLLGESPIWPDEEAAAFARGTRSLGPGEARMPFDRMLAAQTLVHGFKLLSPDPCFAAYGIEPTW